MKRTDQTQAGFSVIEAMGIVVVAGIIGGVGTMAYFNLLQPKTADPTTNVATKTSSKNTTYYLTNASTLKGVAYENYNTNKLDGYTTSF
jgi:hypothetical protein